MTVRELLAQRKRPPASPQQYQQKAERLPSFYFAGKVSGYDNWRGELLNFEWRYTGGGDIWKSEKKGVLGVFDYTGPFLRDFGHGDVRHDVNGVVIHFCDMREEAAGLCLQAVKNCDIVFAWIDQSEIHGSLIEIGFAVGLGKKIWIGIPRENSEEIITECWFLYHLSGYSAASISYTHAATAKEAFLELLKQNRLDGHLICESPIERSFWEHAQELQGITPQFQVGNYRLDFAFPALKVAIELDGHEYHSSKEQRTADAQRDRFLSLQGWRVLRFTGSEIYRDSKGCVTQVSSFLETLRVEQERVG